MKDNSKTLTDPINSKNDRDTSSFRGNSPRLTHRGLTVLLVTMCLVPTITIGVLWAYLPKVYEGQLLADAWAENLPGPEFYQLPFNQRQPITNGILHIQNQSDQVWTMLNIQINHFYQIYDRDPLGPGEQRAYELEKFVTRTGAAFDMRYNPVRNIRIYARRPTKDRATFFKDFETPTGKVPPT